MLLKETSDDSAASIVVPQVVKARLSNAAFYEYILSRHSPLFYSNHLLFTRQTASLRVLHLGLSVLLLWILSVLRLILIVSHV